MRPDEKGLSGSWFEFCSCSESERLGAIIMEWRGQNMVIKRTGWATIGLVQDIKAVGRTHNRKLRVRHEPFSGSPAYAQVRGIRVDDLDLLEDLAANAITQILPCS